MEWKKQLYALEKNKQWDDAIAYMEWVIGKNQRELDAYLAMIYLLMNLMVEENYDKDKLIFYWDTCARYFTKSYRLFCDNAEYLFFAGKIACPAEWFCGLEDNESIAMIERAVALKPDNFIYRSDIHLKSDKTHRENVRQAQLYARAFLQPDAPHRKYLHRKGHLGEYFLGMKDNWCREMFERYPNLIDAGYDGVIHTFPFHDDTSGS